MRSSLATVSVLASLVLAGCAALQEPAAEEPEDHGWTPLQLGLLEDVQLFDGKRTVYGLRLGALSSRSEAVYGLDLTLGKGNTNKGGGGISAGLIWNHAGGDFWGVQTTLGLNNLNGPKRPDPTERLVGAQVALVGNNAANVTGLQLAGVVNVSQGATGFQVGLGNGAKRIGGAQVGIYNLVETGIGLQLGAVNQATGGLGGIQLGLWNQTAEGLQIGLLNFHENGFLPVFPFFNF